MSETKKTTAKKRVGVGPKEHRLKTWPVFFQHMVENRKQFEVREDDREFRIRDTLLLEEWDESEGLGLYTGRQLRARVIYKLDGGRFGIDPAYCVLGVEMIGELRGDLR